MTSDEENKLIEIASRWQWICYLLDGKQISDFALSFPEIRKLDDILAGIGSAKGRFKGHQKRPYPKLCARKSIGEIND